MESGGSPETTERVVESAPQETSASLLRVAAPGAHFSAEDIARHPLLVSCIRQQASTLLAIHAANPRISSIFATQQRWLMAHVALAHSFRSRFTEAGGGFNSTRFIEAIASYRVASRNTADAFLKEMQKYGYLQSASAGRDRRIRRLEPTSISIESISGWLATHLATLDGLDGGARCAAFMAQPSAIAAIQPLVAEGLLQSSAIRDPAPAFSLFTWLNEGGIVMDWLIAGLTEASLDGPRFLSKVSSFADLGERINLSRSHLVRKLRIAEAMGSLGWLGERGKSPMWVSADFAREYHLQQSLKLSIIDRAFRQGLAAQGRQVAVADEIAPIKVTSSARI
jgi:hypothetical protein